MGRVKIVFVCPHCQQQKTTPVRARGLCRTCWLDQRIRAKYQRTKPKPFPRPTRHRLSFVYWRMEIPMAQMEQIRTAAGTGTILEWVVGALKVGCLSPAALDPVARSTPTASMFLEMPTELAARADSVIAHVGVTRTAFCRACFAAALKRG